MQLYLVRHGETQENKKRIIQGHIPGILSALGIRQAEKLAKRFSDTHLDAIYTSDLARAADTAKRILKYHPGLTLHVTTVLRERDMGEYSGKIDVPIHDKDPHNGLEPLSAMARRAKQLLDDLFATHKNQTILLVGHAAINTIIYMLVTGRNINLDNFLALLKQSRNTGVSLFEFFEDGNHNVHLHNCTDHLETEIGAKHS